MLKHKAQTPAMEQGVVRGAIPHCCGRLQMDRHRLRHNHHAPAGGAGAKAKICILKVEIEALVKGAEPVQQFAARHERRTRDIVHIPDFVKLTCVRLAEPVVIRQRQRITQDAAGMLDQVAFGVEQLATGHADAPVVGHDLGQPAQPIGPQNHIVVQEGDQLPLCHAQTRVHPPGIAQIAPLEEKTNLGVGRGDPFRGAIGGAIVHHEHLGIGVILGQDRGQAASQQLPAIPV